MFKNFKQPESQRLFQKIWLESSVDYFSIICSFVQNITKDFFPLFFFFSSQNFDCLKKWFYVSWCSVAFEVKLEVESICICIFLNRKILCKPTWSIDLINFTEPSVWISTLGLKGKESRISYEALILAIESSIYV